MPRGLSTCTDVSPRGHLVYEFSGLGPTSLWPALKEDAAEWWYWYLCRLCQVGRWRSGIALLCHEFGRRERRSCELFSLLLVGKKNQAVGYGMPGLRIPKNVDFSQSLGESLPKSVVERLSALRTRIVVMAAQEAPKATKPKRKTATQHGGSSFSDLLQGLEDYLPVLLGLVKDGNKLKDKVHFAWINQEDDTEVTVMANAWYEVLSVLHLMAMLCLSEANALLLPKTASDSYQPKVTEEGKRNSVDVFLKAAGYLDCAIRHVLPQIPPEVRRDLPIDLAEEVLRALCMQALGQCVDIQLGMAIDSPKATLAVKAPGWHVKWLSIGNRPRTTLCSFLHFLAVMVGEKSIGSLLNGNILKQRLLLITTME
ncbi:hypothetical protein J5N97_022873 [Dioscorea zingiberensis]|uniref:BRO1 domain-containing protein n=1 Tax=Dioscorea zingiberensis TaxID=325984 RepID=A0A9D5CAY7_9LILI|nr:hypothetical protein J5N97_022873 [Dioscorea zingiberensis]